MNKTIFEKIKRWNKIQKKIEKHMIPYGIAIPTTILILLILKLVTSEDGFSSEFMFLLVYSLLCFSLLEYRINSALQDFGGKR